MAVRALWFGEFLFLDENLYAKATDEDGIDVRGFEGGF